MEATIDDQKKQLRQTIFNLIKKKDLTALSQKANQILTQRYNNFSAKIALYWPFQTEIDLTRFMGYYHQKGGVILLPSIVDASSHLSFYKWHPEMTLVKSLHNTVEAVEKSYDIPDIVIVPLLACDRETFRLGRGGGYYDRTMVFYKNHHPNVTFISIVASFQIVDRVPRGQHDQKLDEIIII